MTPLDPALRRRLLVAGGTIATLVLGLVLYALSSALDRPTLQELQLLYPYGFQGAVGPRGERAAGAHQVTFTFKKKVACTKHSDDLDCLLYEYSAGSFSGSMVVRKDGQFWVRNSEDGMPFRPQ